MKKEKKYTGRLHVNANTPEVRAIGIVEADSLKELKEKARRHARSWGWSGRRIHVSCDEQDREFYVNA